MLKKFIPLLLLIAVILITFIPSYSRMQDLRAKNERYAQEIINLKKENKRLTEERRRLQDDPEYLEKVAREKMGLIKEGEVLYRLTPAKDDVQ